MSDQIANLINYICITVDLVPIYVVGLAIGHHRHLHGTKPRTRDSISKINISIYTCTCLVGQTSSGQEHIKLCNLHRSG